MIEVLVPPTLVITGGISRSNEVVSENREDIKDDKNIRNINYQTRFHSLQSIIIPMSLPKILLVDDDPLALIAVQGMLTKLGCEVLTAGNGKLALDMLEKTNCLTSEDPIQLAIIDANMPVMNGYETAREICSRIKNGLLVQLKLICLSAQDSESHAHLCKESGMDIVSIFLFKSAKIVEKPCTMESLQKVFHALNMLPVN